MVERTRIINSSLNNGAFVSGACFAAIIGLIIITRPIADGGAPGL